MKNKSDMIRASKELSKIITFIKAKHLMSGRKPPSTKQITAAIAKRINKEVLFRDEFIKF